MEKIQEWVKEGTLAKNLLADKEFVDGAKEIFKSENIEITDEKLTQLMGEIETQLKKSSILDDKALEEVSGGVSGKGIGRGIVKTVTTVAGAALGSLAGISPGEFIGGQVEQAFAYAGGAIEAVKEGVPISGNASLAATFGKGGGKLAGEAKGALVGLGIGGYAGYELGNWICKKAGLEEA